MTYRYPGFSPTGPPAQPVTLSGAYQTNAATTIDERLMLGGARLAQILNDALDRR